MSILTPEILSELELQGIELPSWAFGNSGTRFRVWTTGGTPRDPYEKIADAAKVNEYTGARAQRRPAHPVGQGR